MNVLVCVIGFSLLAFCGWGVSAGQCYATAERMGVPGEYEVWAGCFVQVDGRWVPLDSVRTVTEAGPK